MAIVKDTATDDGVVVLLLAHQDAQKFWLGNLGPVSHQSFGILTLRLDQLPALNRFT